MDKIKSLNAEEMNKMVLEIKKISKYNVVLQKIKKKKLTTIKIKIDL
ncbi:MAG: hypothetical protein MRERC_2c151 [Mycoplasmataceae bacterium RC_NB112A]|nr:MAG: hypothetical protein MRERC_2c151 [Mycoplasmataceae bacterium RC_NB112A]